MVRARTAAETLTGFAMARRLRTQLQLPVYAHHGTADKVTSLKVSSQGSLDEWPIILSHARCQVL